MRAFTKRAVALTAIGVATSAGVMFSAGAASADVTGGTIVEFSNVALTFENGAAGHFGLTPLHGVVRKVTFEREAGQ